MNESTTRAYLLTNGTYSVLMTPRGGGGAALSGYALTRWEPDPTRDTMGSFCYVTDRESGEYWSATESPCASVPATGSVHAFGDRLETTCIRAGIAIEQEIFVAGGINAEVRRIRVTNRDTRRRTLDVTTYSEIALNTPAGVAGHPAFSKLFVQTGWDAERNALIAWRRLRSPDDQPLWIAQRITGATAPVEYDTDRMRVVGRTRSVVNPAVLGTAGPLGSTTGTVLDPVFCMRTSFSLDPAQHGDLEVTTFAATSRAELEAMLDARDELRPAATGETAPLGLPQAWLDGLAFIEDDSTWIGTLPAPAAHALADTASDADYGRFSDDGTEYVLTVGAATPPTPQPWINVLANEEFGCIVSESGAGYTWAVNSRENRITTWSNDPVSDPHSETLFIRDDVTHQVWSPLPGPCPADTVFDVHHGFGYSSFAHTAHDLRQRVTIFVPRKDTVRIALLEIANDTNVARTLSVFSCAELVLGSNAAAARTRVVTAFDTGVIYATNTSRGEFSDRVTFAACCGMPVTSATGSRASFFGQGGSASDPAALEWDMLDERFGVNLDPCAALHVRITIPAHSAVECAFLLGEEASRSSAAQCAKRYTGLDVVHTELSRIRDFWRDLLGAVRVETPVRALDVMLNGWLTYQNVVCRMWARSALYQSGGAFGFRDQLQDSSALVYYDPQITRDQIVLHASHQFVEGDVLHWWHPPISKGIRTRFSDDLLWLPYIALFYIARTGDTGVLDESARFLTAPDLEPGEDEVFVFPADSGESASVYEHCCRALDRSLTSGAHGLPLMGTGDWNDGMNRVGRLGRGESVWLGFFLFDILHDMIPVCEARGDTGRSGSYRAYLEQLEAALNDKGWDGQWYRRAFYDDGAPLGSRVSDECRIDTLAQAWAVISRAAPMARARSAMDAMLTELVDRENGLIRLLTPAFDKTPHDPGYIKGYVPGVRENGGQYTHAAIWAVRAIAEMGDRDSAAALMEMLTPVHHTRSAVAVERYQCEPYVVAADVYGVAPHVGRGGWSWYTGSAGWMSRVALESVLGFTIENGSTIRMRPCIPAEWPGFTLTYRFPDGTRYFISVRQTDGTTTASIGSVEDGAISIPVILDGAGHEVNIALGPDVKPRYVPRVAAAAAPLL